MKSRLIISLVSLSVVIIAVYWLYLKPSESTDFYQTNGRIEAEQVLVASKFAARIDKIFIEEGQYIEAGGKIAQLDMKQIESQYKASLAQIQQAQKAANEANTVLKVRKEEADLALSQWKRGNQLKEKGFLSDQDFDKLTTQKLTSESAVELAYAGVEQAKAAIDVATANAEQLESVLDDGLILAPRSGRIQYLLSQEGEVLAAGGRLAALLDLQQVYMSVFVPSQIMTRLPLDAQARLSFSSTPNIVVPAKVTFIASEAQFTPKAVETESERDNLMFKIKLSIPKALLEQHEKQIKTGVRGNAFIRLNDSIEWPETLKLSFETENNSEENIDTSK
jgi:HlyD family secretion protein